MALTEWQALLNQAAAAANDNEPMKAIELYTELLSLTDRRSTDDRVREARLTALRERGRLFNLMGEPQAALAGYEQYYVEADGNEHAVHALVAIGNQCTYMNQTDRAIEAHRDALRLAESLNYTTGRAMALGGIGLVFTFLDRSEESVTHLRKSLYLFEQVGDKVEQAQGWNRVGVSHVRLGQLDKAIEAFQNSFRLAREVGQSEPIAMETAIISVNNLGECYQNLFDMEQAMVNHEQGLVMAEHTELPFLEADLCRNLGVDLCQLNRVEEGIAYLNRSLDLSQKTNQPDVEVQTLYSLALAELQRGNLEGARNQAEKLRDLADERRNQGSLAEALHVLGLYHEERGEIESAQGLWQQALFLAHETGRRMLLWRIHSVLARIAPSDDLANVHNRIASEIIQQIAHPIDDEALREKFLKAEPVKNVFNRLSQRPGRFGRLPG